jgi:hypothetical protein
MSAAKRNLAIAEVPVLQTVSFMQDQSSNDNASGDGRAASIKLVFKKAMLSKLGQSVSSVAEHLKDEGGVDTAPETPRTAAKKNDKQSAPAKKQAQKTNTAPPKAAISKANPAKSSPLKVSSKSPAPKSVSKKVASQKQKRSEQSVDAASITSDLGRAVMSSTAGLDFADAAGDAIPMNRVRRIMKELLGDVKLSNESVAAVVCSCHGFINYLTSQVSQIV